MDGLYLWQQEASALSDGPGPLLLVPCCWGSGASRRLISPSLHLCRSLRLGEAEIRWYAAVEWAAARYRIGLGANRRFCICGKQEKSERAIRHLLWNKNQVHIFFNTALLLTRLLKPPLHSLPWLKWKIHKFRCLHHRRHPNKFAAFYRSWYIIFTFFS